MLRFKQRNAIAFIFELYWARKSSETNSGRCDRLESFYQLLKLREARLNISSRIPRVELVHGNRNLPGYLAVERFIRTQRLPDFCIRIVRTFGNLEPAPRRLAPGFTWFIFQLPNSSSATRRVRLRIFILVLPQFRIGLVHKVSSSCGYLIRHQVRLHVILYPAEAA